MLKVWQCWVHILAAHHQLKRTAAACFRLFWCPAPRDPRCFYLLTARPPRPLSLWPSVLNVCHDPDHCKGTTNTVPPGCPISPFQNYENGCSLFPSLILFMPLGLWPMEGTRRPEPLNCIQTQRPWQGLPFWIRIANLRFIFPQGQTTSQTHGHWKKANKHFPFSPKAPSNVKLRFFFFSWNHKLTHLLVS